jgi:tetratricopeptide (TPR) repeat protein
MKKNKLPLFAVLFLLLTSFCIFAQEGDKRAEADRLVKEIADDIGNENFDDAISKSNRILEIFPDYGDALVLKAVAFQLKGEGQKALENYSQALALKPTPGMQIIAHRMRGVLLYQTGKFVEAIKDFDFVISKDGTEHQDFLFRGWCYFNTDDHRSALENFNAVLRLSPGEKGVRRFRAVSNFRMGNYEKTVEDITEELRINDQPQIEVYLIRANAYRKLGKIELAEADEKKFVELGGELESEPSDEPKKDPETELMQLVQKAEKHFKGREWDAAIKAFNEIIEMLDKNDEELFALYFSRGRAFYEKGDLESAFRDYNEVIKRKPDLSDGYTFRGEAYLKKEDYKNALLDFTKAIELDKTDLLAFRRRAEVFYLTKEYAKAIADASEVLKLDAKYPAGWYYRAASRLESGDYQQAIDDFNEYLKLVPDDFEIYLERAKAFRKLGKIKEAEADELKAGELENKQNPK